MLPEHCKAKISTPIKKANKNSSTQMFEFQFGDIGKCKKTQQLFESYARLMKIKVTAGVIFERLSLILVIDARSYKRITANIGEEKMAKIKSDATIIKHLI